MIAEFWADRPISETRPGTGTSSPTPCRTKTWARRSVPHALGAHVYGTFRRRPRRPLPGRHAQRAVEPDGLAVQHRVLDDVARQRRVLARPPEARRGRDPGGQLLALVLGQHGEHGRVEGTGGDGDHADAEPGQVARDGERPADPAALRPRAGSLAELAVEGGRRGGVDDNAAPPLPLGRV